MPPQPGFQPLCDTPYLTYKDCSSLLLWCSLDWCTRPPHLSGTSLHLNYSDLSSPVLLIWPKGVSPGPFTWHAKSPGPHLASNISLADDAVGIQSASLVIPGHILSVVIATHATLTIVFLVVNCNSFALLTLNTLWQVDLSYSFDTSTSYCILILLYFYNYIYFF